MDTHVADSGSTIVSTTDGEKDLVGYQQELHRGVGLWGTFSTSFGIESIFLL